MKATFATAACLVGLFACVSGPAQAQIQKGFPFASKRQNSPTVAELNEQAGPWMVMCASFVGESADVDAERLAAELQKTGFKPYLYRKSFDFSQPIEGVFHSANPENVDVLPDGQLVPKRQMMRAARESNNREVAVLIGDFPTIDDNRAQKALRQIKTLQIDLGAAASHEQMTESFRSNNLTPTQSEYTKGALGSAFLITNPMLPDEYFAAGKVDREIISLNQDFRHSLLNNPGIYSVRIATFRGEQTFKPNEIVEEEKKFFNLLNRRESAKSSKLVEAGLKASVLTKVLRDEGIEAWEFHDRFESYVCVGSFDWLSRENSLGLEENNPDVVALIENYRGSTTSAGGMNNIMQPKAHKKLATHGITYDAQPVPVMVPGVYGDKRNAKR